MSDDKNNGHNFDGGDDVFGDDPFGTTPESGAKPEAGSPESEGFEGFEGFGGDAEPEVAPQSSAPKRSNGIVDLLKENVIYIVGGIVVLIVLYYVIFDYIFASPPQPRRAPVQQQAQQQGFGLTTTPKIVPKKTQAQEVQTRPAGNYLTLSKTELKSLVEGFSKVVSDKTAVLQKQISAIQSSESSLSTNQLSFGKTVTADSKTLETLSTAVTKLNTELTTYNQNMTKISKSLTQTQAQLRLLLAQKAQGRDLLSLRAVVPGRAWLVDKNDHTTTVQVGDMVPDYGKVEKIDAKSGAVIMSSGYVFN